MMRRVVEALATTSAFSIVQRLTQTPLQLLVIPSPSTSLRTGSVEEWSDWEERHGRQSRAG